MFLEMGFGDASAQPLVQKLRYGFQFDVAHGFEQIERPKMLRMEFNGNQLSPMGLNRFEVGGVNVLTTHYRLNAAGVFEGYSAIDFGLLAVGVAGLAAIGTEVFDSDETEETPLTDDGGEGGEGTGGDEEEECTLTLLGICIP
ncbi:hypothetical protein [uncultured Abyssibacter sp.]|uniref:hypothetical protein n=1 Tax=uncultured Abyssibacter sp. TaxID=2320202 RepID=UPI0032B13B1C